MVEAMGNVTEKKHIIREKKSVKGNKLKGRKENCIQNGVFGL